VPAPADYAGIMAMCVTAQTLPGGTSQCNSAQEATRTPLWLCIHRTV